MMFTDHLKIKTTIKFKLEKSGFQEVLAIEANPFPTIRPLNKSIEKFLIKIYNFILVFLKFFFKNDLFFNCSNKLSRCHFYKVLKDE